MAGRGSILSSGRPIGRPGLDFGPAGPGAGQARLDFGHQPAGWSSAARFWLMGVGSWSRGGSIFRVGPPLAGRGSISGSGRLPAGQGWILALGRGRVGWAFCPGPNRYALASLVRAPCVPGRQTQCRHIALLNNCTNTHAVHCVAPTIEQQNDGTCECCNSSH